MPVTTETTRVCTAADIGLELTGPDAAPYIAAMNKYLAKFANPITRDHGEENWVTGTCLCLNCMCALDGVLGTFQWGLASGEGKCVECGWPCRAHHYPKIDGENIFDGVLQMILQYRPKSEEGNHANPAIRTH